MHTTVFGIPHARLQCLDNLIERAFAMIKAQLVSEISPEDVPGTGAEPWSELMLVHRFRDGNDRS